MDLKPLGDLVYTMTATGPEQVDFMRSAGMPVSIQSRKSFTEVSPPNRLAYLSLIDFVPDHVPYQHLTTVDIEPTDGGGSHVTMTVAPMHDAEWTERLVAGRSNELDNLGRLVAAGSR